MDLTERIRKAEAGSVVHQSIFRWLSAASKGGGSRAVANLGHMYAEALGIPKNIPEAMRHFNAVSSSEYAAQIGLARIYARENGVPIDRKAAVKWYKTLLAPFTSGVAVHEDTQKDIQEALDYIAEYDLAG